MRRLIREEMRRFIARHRLGEFLANAGPVESFRESEENGQPGYDFDSTPAADSEESAPGAGLRASSTVREAPIDFVSRDALTDLFYRFTHGFSEQTEDLGVELKWIGVGTWETPSEIIPEQYLEAWQLSCENQLLGSRSAISTLRKESRNNELLRLIREIPVTSFERLSAKGLQPDEIKHELLLLYREKLRNAWEYYQSNKLAAPAELEATLKHLSRLTARWLS